MNPCLIRIICFTAFSMAVASAGPEERFYMGRIDLAGLVPDSLPSRGAELPLHSVEKSVTGPGGKPVGFVPVRFRESLNLMVKNGVTLVLRVEKIHSEPQPGRFLTVSVWAYTTSMEPLRPLIQRESPDWEMEWVQWARTVDGWQ